MVSWLKKWRTAGIVFSLIVASIAPLWAASVPIPLSHEEESFPKPGLHPLSSEVKESTSAAISGSQGFKTFLAKVGSGLTFIRKNAVKAFIIALAILPTAEAFKIDGLNQTVSYTANTRGTSCGLPPILISNETSSEYFNVVIRQVDLTAGNLTLARTDLNVSLYSPGVWNVTGSAYYVTFLTLHLLFFNNFSAQSQISFTSQVTEVSTGKTMSGQLNLMPTALAISNLPQFKNYTRNNPPSLDSIVITNFKNDQGSLTSGLVSATEGLPKPSVLKIDKLFQDSSTLQLSLQCTPAKDYCGKLVIQFFIVDGPDALINLLILTCTNPISPTGMSALTSTQPLLGSSSSQIALATTTASASSPLSSGMLGSSGSQLTSGLFSPLTTLVNMTASAQSLTITTMPLDMTHVNDSSTNSSTFHLISSNKPSYGVIGGVVGGVTLGALIAAAIGVVLIKRDCWAARKKSSPPSVEPGNIHPGSQSIPLADSALLTFHSARSLPPIPDGKVVAAPSSQYLTIPAQNQAPAVQSNDSGIIPRAPYAEFPGGNVSFPYVPFPGQSHYENHLPLIKSEYEEVFSTIHKAAQVGDCYLIQVHLGFGVPVDLLNDAGYTPLHLAVMAGQEQACRVLLESGANKELQTKDHKTARMLAQEAHAHSIRALLENSQPISNNPYGKLSLKDAGYRLYSRATVKDSNVQDYEVICTNTLHTAAKSGLCQVIEFHLRLGVPVDLLNEEGLSALHIAAGEGQEKACRLLIHRGAHINLQTNDGMTAAMLAQKNGHSLLALMLEQASSVQNGHPT